MKFALQRAELYSVLRLPNVRGCCIDSTGLGAQLAEEAADEFGFVEPVVFTEESKKDMATRMRRRFEDRLVRAPATRKIRDDLGAVKKVANSRGGVSYVAERNADGHADRFWAKALAERAADAGGAAPKIRSLAGDPREELRRMVGR
jgi:phage FluMu gp28-like protein